MSGCAHDVVFHGMCAHCGDAVKVISLVFFSLNYYDLIKFNVPARRLGDIIKTSLWNFDYA